MSSKILPPKRPPLNESLTFKLNEAEKARLLKYAYDEGDPVSRIIRKALEKALPDIFKNGK